MAAKVRAWLSNDHLAVLVTLDDAAVDGVCFRGVGRPAGGIDESVDEVVAAKFNWPEIPA